ncbi:MULTISPECIES: DUF1415 domain-containing protein [Mycetohabitans]|uniref:DUF1415 domain-containing protein n=2 Tax=Burkholderiales TaxID=80840 RepID=UPI00095CDC69|nr:DUF1415 domain-containing protein [Mycetohabitans sp. B3]MCF2133427.1 DUF1415 domain-containing protein [Mycetohabitans sp. B3]MCG1038977.1 DUF1415 domain-containing protein [Mycetohabitans sp. B7]SIT77908.1 hypothetical protein SAMN04487769_2900 [Burkholderia sp. b14]
MPMHDEHKGHAAVVSATVRWLERAVIGLNLCPFAKSVHVKRQIRYTVSNAHSAADVLAALDVELQALVNADPQWIDTTLLILPDAFADFYAFNDFLPRADKLLRRRALEGIVQIASFHPLFQFAGAGEHDIENYTNRAPYPILHLLREASVTRAVDAFADAAQIYERNEQTMRALGHAGWRRLLEADDERR